MNRLSIVIPVYNSEETINTLVKSIYQELGPYNPEVVLVNDSSKDKSELICEQLAKKNSRIKFISLRRNSGEHNAVICGLNYCKGNYVVIMDDDLQNPASEIIRLLQVIQDGQYDVVYSRYKTKQHSFVRNICSKIHNRATVYLLGKPKKLYLSSFKIINRAVVDEIIAYKGPFPYIDALILRTTDNIGSVYVNHHSRQTGKSNYTFRKLFSLYLNVFINFSNKPLRLITIFGFIISIVSFISIGFIIYEKTMLKNVTPGWAFLAIAMLFLIGLTFIVIGILGEYIGKIMMSINQQPQYIVKKEMNVKDFSETVMEVTNDRESIRV